jgi:hypothetical protein
MSIVKTEVGLQVMKDRSVSLTPRQRSVFILIDGRRTLDELLAAAAAIGGSREDIDHLFALGLIADTAPTPTEAQQAAAEAKDAVSREHNARPPAQRYQEAYPIATKLTAGLGLRGFRLNLAVEAAGNYEQLLELAPRIREAVGPEKYRPLGDALNDR